MYGYTKSDHKATLTIDGEPFMFLTVAGDAYAIEDDDTVTLDGFTEARDLWADATDAPAVFDEAAGYVDSLR